jgi:hypothetical protein
MHGSTTVTSPSTMIGPNTAGQFQEPHAMAGAPYDSVNMPAVTGHPQQFANPQEGWWPQYPHSDDDGNQYVLIHS